LDDGIDQHFRMVQREKWHPGFSSEPQMSSSNRLCRVRVTFPCANRWLEALHAAVDRSERSLHSHNFENARGN
jgi:hypothetical protein